MKIEPPSELRLLGEEQPAIHNMKRFIEEDERIGNQRKNFIEQAVCKLIKQFGLLAVEALVVRNLIRNPKLAKSIADVSWSQFFARLQAKAEEAGRHVVRVNPAGTTQRCSVCGAHVPKTLSQRWHACPACGLSLSRDENAARAILRLGLSLGAPTWPGGASVSPAAVCLS